MNSLAIMAVFILNGFVLILIMSLTSSYVIDDLYPDETETLEDMKSELLELNEMNYMDPNMDIGNNLDMRQVEDIVVQRLHLRSKLHSKLRTTRVGWKP